LAAPRGVSSPTFMSRGSAAVFTGHSPGGPVVGPPAPSPDATSASTYTTSSSSTSYGVPSVQTSEDGGAPAATDVPTTDDPATDDPTQTPTTTANPYGTTTPTNAGHV
jgi:hypothetical protein